LGIPSLGAYLREQGIRTLLIDVDIESLLGLLQPDTISRAGFVLHKRSTLPGASKFELARLAVLSERLPETVPEALSVLQTPVKFFDPYALASARQVILDGLDLLSAACARPVHYSIEPLRYEVDGVDATRFADLVHVTADRDANLFADYWETELFPKLEQTEWDLVGVSIATRFQLVPGLMLARWLRNRGHFVLIGGSLMPRFAERLARLPEFFEIFADGVVIGDGETALTEIVYQLNGSRRFDQVPNYLFCERGQVRRTRAHFENLAALPAPDFTDLPLDRYLSPVRVLPLVIGRGCYYSLCKFCEISYNNRNSPQPHRLRPAEMVVADIIGLADNFDCRFFVIGDEAVHPEVFEKIADGLISRGRKDLRFAAYARFEREFTAPLCRKLADMGLRRVLFGLESGSQRMLDHMCKGTRIIDFEPILKNFLDAGIRYLTFAMVGLPEETEECARATFAFFENNAALFAQWGNGFDIRPMELQVCSPYMEEAPKYGLLVAPELLTGEFVVGVGQQWENTGGISRSQVYQLFSEYAARLDGTYSRFDSWPQMLWPVWDEWGLLYSDCYRDLPFPFRTRLSRDGNGQVQLQWNPAIAVRTEGDSVVVSSRFRTLSLRQTTYAALDRAGFGPPEVLLSRLAGGTAPSDELAGSLRAMIAILVQDRLLQIVPALGDMTSFKSGDELPDENLP
jgi:radical SAM superfamily enzyme YgiQ (UPF0313 family)